MPLTQQEKNRLDAIWAASNDPNVTGGEGFSIKVLHYMFMEIVRLRDFAQESQDTVQNLRQRLRRLEDKVLNEDTAEVLVKLTPLGEEHIE